MCTPSPVCGRLFDVEEEARELAMEQTRLVEVLGAAEHARDQLKAVRWVLPRMSSSGCVQDARIMSYVRACPGAQNTAIRARLLGLRLRLPRACTPAHMPRRLWGWRCCER